MSELNIALAMIGGLVLAIGLLSGLLRRTIISEPLVALLVGALIGPAVLGLLDVAGGGQQETILEQAARLTLAIGGFAPKIRVGY